MQADRAIVGSEGATAADRCQRLCTRRAGVRGSGVAPGDVGVACGAPREGDACRGTCRDRLPGQHANGPAGGRGGDGPGADSQGGAGRQAGMDGGGTEGGRPPPSGGDGYGTTTPPDDHRVARRRKRSCHASRRAGDSRGGETPHHPAAVDGESPGHHPDRRRRGRPADGPRRRRTSGCRATPRYSAGPSHLDMERRLGGGRSLGRMGWRPDHPTIRRREEDPDSGPRGVQQHPRRAGCDARRARGGVAAGGRPGRDPADPLHRLAGSARHAGNRRWGPEVCDGRRDLVPAHLSLRRKTGPPAVGPGPLWATRQRTGG